MPDPALHEFRTRLLFATLAHVPFDGWTQAALAAAARDLNVPMALAQNAFPGGIAEMLDFFSGLADGHMMAGLDTPQFAALKVREKIAAAVRLRLQQNEPFREAIRLGLSVLALPQNAVGAARSLYRTVDLIWYAAGDRSTDYNFYTKRALLAGVYTTTLLYWLNDSSPDHVDSWAFLERRIDDVMRIPKLTQRVKRLASWVPDPFRLFHQPHRSRSTY